MKDLRSAANRWTKFVGEEESNYKMGRRFLTVKVRAPIFDQLYLVSVSGLIFAAQSRPNPMKHALGRGGDVLAGLAEAQPNTE